MAPPTMNVADQPRAEVPLSHDLLHKMDAYWRAANYVSVGQIYLYDNPLLKRPLQLAAQLQREGAEAFVESWNDLMKCIESKAHAALAGKGV